MSNYVSDLVRPGDRLELVLINDKIFKTTSDEEKKVYVTKVLDISEDDDMVQALMPIEKTKLILLPEGARYEASFFCKKGIYGCIVKVIKRYKSNNLFLVDLEPLSELKKQQRREFYRLDCVIGMNTRQLTDKEVKEYRDRRDASLLASPEDKSVIVDISGGGLRFVSAEHYEVGKCIYCRFVISSNETERTMGVIMKLLATKPVVNNPKNTEYRGNFYELNNVDRELIIKYIFEEQRKLRQNR